VGVADGRRREPGGRHRPVEALDVLQLKRPEFLLAERREYVVADLGEVVVVGAVGHVVPDHVFHPPPEVLAHCSPGVLAEEPGLRLGHLLLELVQGFLLGLGVDVALLPARCRRVLELSDPATVALAPVDASLSVDPFFGSLYYGLLLSSITL